MELPANLIQDAQQGKVVLFLGAGASLSSQDSAGNAPPTGKRLGEMLSDRFLGGKFRESQLGQIAEYAISESDLTTVQEYIREIFDPFKPSEAHKLMPAFRWAGLATTNYDRLIETAYESNSQSLQIPRLFIENGDRVEENLRDPKAVMLLKLHGCVTRLTNQACPLILTTDQYISHRAGRSRIFDHLKGWGYERTFVFIGYSLQDPDIRAIMLELLGLAENRPRNFIVAPKVDDIEVRFWESRRITPLKSSFEDFMKALNGAIPTTFRALVPPSSTVKHPIAAKFASNNVTLSRNCIQFLESDVDYVKSATVTEVLDPKYFYKGHNKDWSAIEQNLDVKRVLGDTILVDSFLAEEARRPPQMEFIVIKAHAGAGKSVLMRRIAWDAAHDYDLLCFFLKPSGGINTAALQELIIACDQRVYLFVDDAGDRIRELQSLAKNIQEQGKKLTVIAAERLNEWNVTSSGIAALVTSEYELKYLSSIEIERLLTLLQKHRALGTLENKTPDEQKKAFHEVAGRQLLVALHEATLGKPFEDIIEDEFQNIVPLEAQRIYLTICVLNRLGVPVRANIIARLHGIPFSDFQKRLFKPLEHVVYTSFDSVVRDYMYVARHPVIAEIVFERILKNQEERFDIYLKCLKPLNIDYSCDRRAFRQMIRGRLLIDMFPNPEMVKAVYNTAKELVGEDAYYYHQKGLYEMHTGHLVPAGELLTKAELIAPYDISIKHSHSELFLKLAEQSRTAIEKEKHLREATRIAEAIRGSKPGESYVYHTLVKADIQRLQGLLANNSIESSKAEIQDVVNRIEKNLTSGLQQFPGDSYLLTAESSLADLLKDLPRVVESLCQAFEANPRTGFIAIRLASHFQKQGKIKEARDIFEKALNANRNDRPLHYKFAKHIMECSKSDHELIEYHLQRAFSPGDSNYDAQLLYGRQLYINGNRDGSKKVFNQLKLARVSPEWRETLLYPLEDESVGTIARIEGNYAYISKDRTNEWIYVHRSNMSEDVWVLISIGVKVSYKVGFNFHGPGAFDVNISGNAF
jgi:tetratricopeptide (TPR) repeat protein